MGTLPSTNSGLLAFCQQRAPVWAASAVSIGLNSNLTTAFTSVTSAAEAAYLAQQTAVENARGATVLANQALDALRDSAGELLRMIRAYAGTAEDPGQVFSTAKIPPTRTPAPIGPPGMPANFAVTVNTVGALQLKWRCPNPPGCNHVVYTIQRQLNQSGPYTLIASVPEREFVDSTVPAGTSIVNYRITATRAGKSGNPGIWAVQFGMDSGGGGALTLFSVKEAKEAA